MIFIAQYKFQMHLEIFKHFKFLYSLLILFLLYFLFPLTLILFGSNLFAYQHLKPSTHRRLNFCLRLLISDLIYLRKVFLVNWSSSQQNQSNADANLIVVSCVVKVNFIKVKIKLRVYFGLENGVKVIAYLKGRKDLGYNMLMLSGIIFLLLYEVIVINRSLI